MRKYSNNVTHSLCRTGKDGNKATMGSSHSFVGQRSLNSVYNEYFRGTDDAKAQIFWKPNMKTELVKLENCLSGREHHHIKQIETLGNYCPDSQQSCSNFWQCFLSNLGLSFLRKTRPVWPGPCLPLDQLLTLAKDQPPWPSFDYLSRSSLSLISSCYTCCFLHLQYFILRFSPTWLLPAFLVSIQICSLKEAFRVPHAISRHSPIPSYLYHRGLQTFSAKG